MANCLIKPFKESISNSLFKSIFLFSVALLSAWTLFAQPSISTFTPTSGPVGTTVTITGSGFNTSPSANTVFFGAVKATVTAATSASLTVKVPAGATYQSISVTTNGLTAFSSKPFVVTFSGGMAIDPTSFIWISNDTTDLHPNGLAVADFDDDGKPDLATPNNYSKAGLPASVSVLRNAGSIGAISFESRKDLITGVLTYAIAAGDLDGDGKPDLVSTSIKDQTVSVFKNTSSVGNITFAPKIDFAAGDNPLCVAIGDMDGDGKPDLVIANNLSNSISIYRNTSTLGSLSFASKVDFTTALNPYWVSIGDLDGDGKPDLVVTNEQSSSISVFRNISTLGSLSFSSRLDYTCGTGNKPKGVAIGDLDGDGKSDVIVVVNNVSSSGAQIFKNSSTPGSVSLSIATSFSHGQSSISYHVAIGDLNGDGKPDVAVSTSYPYYLVKVYQNNSTPGVFSWSGGNNLFASWPYSIGIVDLDEDGKADMAATNFVLSSISVFKNRNGEPIVSSFSPAKALTGQTVTISGSNFTGTTSVSFGGVPASSFVVHSSNSIAAIVGEGASGHISVTNASGTGTKDNFTFVAPPVITNFTPVSGGAGTKITIQGNHFTEATAVSFGGVPAVSFEVVSPTIITAIVGAGASGPVTVTNPYGTISLGSFTFFPSPVITSVTPESGGSGTSVTITGDHFSNVKEVSFGGTPAASFQIVSPTSITAIVGEGAGGKITVSSPGGTAFSQTVFSYPPPVITSFSPVSGPAGTTITITGANFRSNPDDNIVFFGAVKGKVVAGGRNSLTVLVPYGATYEPLSLTLNNYTAVANQPFLLTYPDASSGFSSGSFVQEGDFKIGADACKRILLSDLDGDGKSDVLTDGKYTGMLSILRNTSDNDIISYAPRMDLFTGNTSSMVIGDIDSDGKPDLITFNWYRIFSVYRNTSVPGSISFAPKVDFSSIYSPFEVGVGDFDGDGRIDLAVSDNDIINRQSYISLFKNIGTRGTIAFAPRVDFKVRFAPVNIIPADIDMDGKTDILFGSDTISILRNTSTPGNFSFAPVVDFPTLYSNSPYAVGDVDGDKKPDLISVHYYDKSFTVLRNTGQPGNISFAPNQVFALDFSPGSIHIGQLDGDGKPDLVLVNTATLERAANIFKNTSIIGTVSFGERQEFAVPDWFGAFRSGDLNGDGRPDLAALNSGDKQVVFYKNQVGDSILKVCPASSLTLTPGITGSVYQWQVNNGSGFTNLSNVSFYSGVQTNAFQINNVSSSLHGYRYRCVVDGNYSINFILSVLSVPTPSVSITASATTICTGIPVTFTAIPTDGGTDPVYQWQVNGVNKGNNSTVFTTSALNNNDQIKIILTSSGTCMTGSVATSNVISITVNPLNLLTGKVTLPSQVCNNNSFTVTFTGTNTPDGSGIQLWESVNAGAFNAISSQTFSGTPLHFTLNAGNSMAVKKYFFKITPPTSITCAMGNNSDTAAIRIEYPGTPVVALLNGTINITNPVSMATYGWQVQQNSNVWNDIPAVSGISYTPSEIGTYRAREERGPCSAYSNAVILTLDPRFANADGIYQYPNPATNWLTLDSLKLSDHWAVLDILSADGSKTMASIPIENLTRVTVPVGHLKPGLYLAVLRRRNGTPSTIRFMKI